MGSNSPVTNSRVNRVGRNDSATSDGPVTAEKNTRRRVSVMVTRWRRWLRCGVPPGKRVHPPPQQLCHRTEVHKNLRFKSYDVSLKHPWRPERGRVPYPRVGVRNTRNRSPGKSHNQGCQEFDCSEKRGQMLNDTGYLMGTRPIMETTNSDLEEGQRREEYGGWTSARREGTIERKSKHPVARVCRSHGRRLGYQRILTAYRRTTDDEVAKIQLMRVDKTVRRRIAPSPLLI